MSVPFHLSLCVADLASSREFYVDVLGCREGRSAAAHVDFDFFGNQLTCHLAPEKVRPASVLGLDGNHFGAIVSAVEFARVAAAATARGVPFITAPETHDAGTSRERRR